MRVRREAMGLSVYEVFRKTRVPIHSIEALERGDIQNVPGTCYAMGFLKTYCLFLGIDPERYLDALRACSQSSPPRFLRRKSNPEFKTPAWLESLTTWAVITAILILGWVTYTAVFRPQVKPEESRVNAAVEMVAPPVPTEPGL